MHVSIWLFVLEVGQREVVRPIPAVRWANEGKQGLVLIDLEYLSFAKHPTLRRKGEGE
jgi:hypothetical protein